MLTFRSSLICAWGDCRYNFREDESVFLINFDFDVNRVEVRKEGGEKKAKFKVNKFGSKLVKILFLES